MMSGPDEPSTRQDKPEEVELSENQKSSAVRSSQPDVPITETLRLQRRRAWHVRKIKESAQKHVLNRPASRNEYLDSPKPNPEPTTSTQTALEIASCPLPDRSPGQWKIIRELKLCSGCLTRTTPPHKPHTDGAPCEGRPYALFDKVNIGRIRKELTMNLTTGNVHEWKSMPPLWIWDEGRKTYYDGNLDIPFRSSRDRLDVMAMSDGTNAKSAGIGTDIRQFDLLSASSIPTREITATLSMQIDQEYPQNAMSRDKPEAAKSILFHQDEVVTELSMRDIDWSATQSSGHRIYAASNSSGSRSDAASVLSTTSLASSATDLSKHSIYSADQIARATKELIVILQEDTALAVLYKHAIRSSSIGPERLERNLRRLFRGYADLLDKAAGDTIELHAARLVKMKARAVARSIVQKYDSDRMPQMKVTQMKMKQEQDQSSEEENDTNEVDERIFEDLVHFRDFLIRGEAFSTLHAQIQSFILPKPIRQEMSENNKGKGKLRNDRLDVDTLGDPTAPLRFEAPTNIDLWSSRAIVETLISETPREIRLRGRSKSLQSLRNAQVSE
jgi:hypothetical protein